MNRTKASARAEVLASYIGQARSSRRRSESLERKIEELYARDPRARRMAQYMRLAERAADDARESAVALGRYVESLAAEVTSEKDDTP